MTKRNGSQLYVEVPEADLQKLGTNSLKSKRDKNSSKVHPKTPPPLQDFSIGAKFSTHFTYRVRIDEMGANFGGEVPRVEGVGGG